MSQEHLSLSLILSLKLENFRSSAKKLESNLCQLKNSNNNNSKQTKKQLQQQQQNKTKKKNKKDIKQNKKDV